jgi:quinol monooxygenase YgiN
MGHMVIAAFRPKPGKEADLLACTRDHLPILRGEDLVTERPSLVLRAQDGTIVEVFEWRSQAAVEAAHANPRVHALWQRYEACCDYVTLGDLPEAKALFPHFELVDLSA